MTDTTDPTDDEADVDEANPSQADLEVHDVVVHVRLHGVLGLQAGGRRRLEVALVPPATVGGLLDVLGERHPGLERRIRDETGAMRRHVNVFVDGEAARGTSGPDTGLRDGAEVLILPAVSGG